ncbi:MAG: cytochrome bd quinol oxidase subunit 2 apoprotein [Phycisphaerales bacterium]|nr:cytochrome bd quinol oxidase subunit 2 apoprotein [Phycisphaerales bacterium]
MSDTTLTYLAAATALLGLMAYAVLAGADFGGGVWDLFASGPRRREQRSAIAHAMGPVWEANHVWLIFVLVVLFTCFPNGYAPLVIALFVPLHLVLAGIMLRGAAFVFRSHGPSETASNGNRSKPQFGSFTVWSVVFGGASVISPLLLGAAFGVVTAGDVRVAADGQVTLTDPFAWLAPYPLTCALLALATCAYLAAVYLTVETTDELREDFRQRAIIAGTATAALAFVVLLVARREAAWFVGQLFSWRAGPVLLAGSVCFIGSAVAVFGRRFRAARVFAAGQTILMLLGWGLAHRDYLIYPDVKLLEARAPIPTIRFLLWTFPIGLAMLIPSLILLFRVFKGSSRRTGGTPDQGILHQ